MRSTKCSGQQEWRVWSTRRTEIGELSQGRIWTGLGCQAKEVGFGKTPGVINRKGHDMWRHVNLIVWSPYLPGPCFHIWREGRL